MGNIESNYKIFIGVTYATRRLLICNAILYDKIYLKFKLLVSSFLPPSLPDSKARGRPVTFLHLP